MTPVTVSEAESVVADLVAGRIDAIDAQQAGAPEVAGALVLDVAMRITGMTSSTLRVALACAVEQLAMEMRT